MKKGMHAFEPHLFINEFSVASGKEWFPPQVWSMAQVVSGTGYCLREQKCETLETGAVLLLSGQTQVVIRASQLGMMTLKMFSVMPSRLTGLITLGEESFLKFIATKKESAARLFPKDGAVASKMRTLSFNNSGTELMARLKLLQLFIEALGGEIRDDSAPGEIGDARERLRLFLQKLSPDELVEMNFDELARKTNCTSRHLSRIFQEVVGKSFRDKRAEVRMTRARELLAGSNSKVVEVALESGYKSLSLFNLVFSRHFGVSPGRWRQRYNNGNAVEDRRQKLVFRI